MKIFYHGSPTSNIKILEPRVDPRLGIEGLFVADEPFGPMVFSLLPVRADAIVNYTTQDGRFIKGKVVARNLNETGWLYTLEAEDELIVERDAGKYYLTAPVRVTKSQKILKEDILKLGWKWKQEE